MQDVALDVWNLGGLSQHSCPCSLHCPISGHKAILQGQTSQKFVDRTWNHEQGCLLISSKALEFIVVLQDLLEPSSQNTTEKPKWCTSAFLRGFIEVEVGTCASVRAWICHVTVCLLHLLRIFIGIHSSSSHKDSKKINRMPLRPQTWTQREVERLTASSGSRKVGKSKSKSKEWLPMR